jgi:hypothetical protein
MHPRATRTLAHVQPILLTPRRYPFNDPAWLLSPSMTAAVVSLMSSGRAATSGESAGRINYSGGTKRTGTPVH